MNKDQLEQLLTTAINASLDAGKTIMDVYNTEFAVEHKEDKSPLTLADKKSHETISKYLEDTNLPVLSEEGRSIPYEERKNWEYLWVVDPLDGTKEFVKRNGEFTVNIALLKEQNPKLGVIYVPVKNTLYFAAKGIGAYKTQADHNNLLSEGSIEGLISKSEKLPVAGNKDRFTVVASRSHMSDETRIYIDQLQEKNGEIEIISAGSALKLCLVAEGRADEYPRFAPTMEWDTAAGQAIAEAAGKQVLDYETGEPVVYNRKNLVNGWFLVK